MSVAVVSSGCACLLTFLFVARDRKAAVVACVKLLSLQKKLREGLKMGG